jgi:hypothetical protein
VLGGSLTGIAIASLDRQLETSISDLVETTQVGVKRLSLEGPSSTGRNDQFSFDDIISPIIQKSCQSNSLNSSSSTMLCSLRTCFLNLISSSSSSKLRGQPCYCVWALVVNKAKYSLLSPDVR